MGEEVNEQRGQFESRTEEAQTFGVRLQWGGADGSSLLAMGRSQSGSPRRVFAYGVSGVADSLSMLRRTVERPLRHAQVQRSQALPLDPGCLPPSVVGSWGRVESHWPGPEEALDTSISTAEELLETAVANSPSQCADGPAVKDIACSGRPETLPVRVGFPQRPLCPAPPPGTRRPFLGTGGYPSPANVIEASGRPLTVGGPVAGEGRPPRPCTGLGTPGEPAAVGALTGSATSPRPDTAPALALKDQESFEGGADREVVAEITLRGVFHTDLLDGSESSSSPSPSISISALEGLFGTQLEALLEHLLEPGHQRTHSPGAGEDSVRRISRFSPTLGSSRGPSPLPLRGPSPPSRPALVGTPGPSKEGGEATSAGVAATPSSTMDCGDCSGFADSVHAPQLPRTTSPIAHCRLLVQRCGDSKATMELSLDPQALRARGSELRVDEVVDLLQAYFHRHEKLRLVSEKAQVYVTVEPYELVQRSLRGQSSRNLSAEESLPEHLRDLPEPPAGMRGDPGRDRNELGQMLSVEGSRTVEQSLWREEEDARPGGASRGSTATRLIREVRERTGRGRLGSSLRAKRYVKAYVMYEPRCSGSGCMSPRAPRHQPQTKERPNKRLVGGSSELASSYTPGISLTQEAPQKMWTNTSHMETFSTFSRRKPTRTGLRVMTELADEKKAQKARGGVGVLSPRAPVG